MTRTLSDLEITKLCAKAMGLHVCDPQCFPAMLLVDAGAGPFNYDPLHDDTQAMALVKKFRIYIVPQSDYWQTDAYLNGEWVGEGNSPDLNRAICECVAKIKYHV